MKKLGCKTTITDRKAIEYFKESFRESHLFDDIILDEDTIAATTSFEKVGPENISSPIGYSYSFEEAEFSIVSMIDAVEDLAGGSETACLANDDDESYVNIEAGDVRIIDSTFINKEPK